MRWLISGFFIITLAGTGRKNDKDKQNRKCEKPASWKKR
jgi:hypothetical protein